MQIEKYWFKTSIILNLKTKLAMLPNITKNTAVRARLSINTWKIINVVLVQRTFERTRRPISWNGMFSCCLKLYLFICTQNGESWQLEHKKATQLDLGRDVWWEDIVVVTVARFLLLCDVQRVSFFSRGTTDNKDFS